MGYKTSPYNKTTERVHLNKPSQPTQRSHNAQVEAELGTPRECRGGFDSKP